METQPDAGSWMEVLPHLDPSYGGLCAVVPRMATELTLQQGMQVQIAAFCGPEEEHLAMGRADISTWPLARSAWAKDTAGQQRFQVAVEGSRGLHIHGLWDNSTRVAAAAARRSGLPYVLSAHGMLERWALRNKRVKKAIYAVLVERKNVQKAACLHALTRAEAEDYRRFGAKNPIAIVPNGIESSPVSAPEHFLNAFPQAKGKRLVLFLGRLHYKKGVDLLVKAWAEIAGQLPDALLVLAGPDSEGTLAKVTETITRAGVQDQVLITGMLTGPMKWSALAAAECFVLPSYSEGLSVAVLEAMSMGLPLILSHECNLPQVEEQGAGWLVPTEVQPLAAAILTALLSSSDQHLKMKNSAKSLAAREFSWNTVAARMAGIYRWVSGGPIPVDVEFYPEAE
ncbi:MAG: glycosyltransferase [Janthinobacterium lividum]